MTPPYNSPGSSVSSNAGRWRTARRLLLVLAAAATLIALFYTVENWRGRRAWDNRRHELEARGEVLHSADTFEWFAEEGKRAYGRIIPPSNVAKRHLHPALKDLGYVNEITGTTKAGTHAFRQFRNTYLKNHTACPSGLYKFWLGHAPTDMSDLYDKIKNDVGFRREWAEKSGANLTQV